MVDGKYDWSKYSEGLAHKVHTDKTLSVENEYGWKDSDQNINRFSVWSSLWQFVMILEMWLNVDVNCFRMHTKLVRCHEWLCWFKFAAQFMNSWQRTNFSCIHLTSMFNHVSNTNTNCHKDDQTKKRLILWSLHLHLYLFSADQVLSVCTLWANPSEYLLKSYPLSIMTILRL